MKVVFDFRKYDGVVGGVEQGVIQIVKYITSIEQSVVILCKRNRIEEVKNIFTAGNVNARSVRGFRYPVVGRLEQGRQISCGGRFSSPLP